jgi:PTS system ascorbate-specific IIA component
MLGYLIIAHAPLASALKTVAGHAFPDCAAMLVAFDVPTDSPIEQTEAIGRELLAGMSAQEVLILTDVFGATPCNVAQKLASDC